MTDPFGPRRDDAKPNPVTSVHDRDMRAEPVVQTRTGLWPGAGAGWR